MPNIQVSNSSSLNNARSESSLSINPNDPMRMVSASKRFNNIHTYDFTLATQYSTDGGHTWKDSAPLAMPGFTVMTDPTMAWDDSGNVFLVGLAGKNPPTWDTIGIVIYKSTDGGKTWSAPIPIHKSADDDKQWVAGDGNPASPHHGNVYAIWDDTAGLAFARTKDHGATWIGAGAAVSPAGGIIASGSVYPEINVGFDGTIYIASISGSEIKLTVSTNGGDTFTAAPSPATGITNLSGSLPTAGGWPVFPGGNFRVITDPTACAFGKTVTVAWADHREGVSRIYFARSLDRGASWTTGPSGKPLLTGPLPANFQHFHPQIVTDPNGVIGCAFYEYGPKPTTQLIDVIMAQSFDGGASFNHFTVTDKPWDPTVDAPWAHGDSSVTFIGDYMGLDASTHGFYPLWTDTRTGIQELWTAVVPERRCEFIVNRSTLGQDEVDALRKQAMGVSAVVKDAFRVVVDGYTAAQIGVTGSGSKHTVVSPSAGMTIHCTGNVSETGSYGTGVQRFTFLYDIDFGSNASDPAFAFVGATKFLTLKVTIVDVSASAELELIKQPNPFILHGDPPWLSIDLRVFVVRAGESKFGVAMGADASTAPSFIQHVAKNLTSGGGSAGGQSFGGLPSDEEHSSLFVYPKDNKNKAVFNFALARVRYIGLIGATDVRVFFRLFQAQTTSGAYDYPPGAHYRRATSNPKGQPIPLAGIQGNEYVTLPFFAHERVDSTTVKMDKQIDAHDDGAGKILGNIQKVVAHADGSEVDTFFGCWLDINQPFKTDGSTPNRVLPAKKDALHPDGPFQSGSNPPLAIQQAILKNLHQCLIAEIAFDPVGIPPGKDPSNWDKLAQRNLAWSDVGSATAVTTFEIRPTPLGLPTGQRPDELMIDWGKTPTESVAKIYLPALDADAILAMASRMYMSHGLSRVDDHTLQCPTGGITYVPVPPRAGANYAGLLSVNLPSTAQPGHAFDVVVRQVTSTFSSKVVEQQPEGKPASEAGLEGAVATGAVAGNQGAEATGRFAQTYSEWRRVLGAFQLTIRVKPKPELLLTEQRQLSVLRWIFQAIPVDSRWYQVFVRYLDVVADRVKAFGGDPTLIQPSATGDVTPDHEYHQPPGAEERLPHTGKISGLIFDRFGDFEGFKLETEEGERTYLTREGEIEALAERAWRERLRLTVWSERDEPRRPSLIIIGEPPVPF